MLIAYKSRLLQIRWCGVAHSRKFTDFFVFRRNDRGVLIGRTLNLNRCTQQGNCTSNSGLPPSIKTLRMILIFQLEISRLMCICFFIDTLTFVFPTLL